MIHVRIEAEVPMEFYTKEELREARRAIVSTTGKCEKALPKLKPGTAQHTLLVRRIKAFQIAAALMQDALDGMCAEDAAGESAGRPAQAESGLPRASCAEDGFVIE